MNLPSETDPYTLGESLVRAAAHVRELKATVLKADTDLAEVRRLENLGPTFEGRLELVRRRKYLVQKKSKAVEDLAHAKRVALDVRTRAKTARCESVLAEIQRLCRDGPQWSAERESATREAIRSRIKWAFDDPRGCALRDGVDESDHWHGRAESLAVIG